MLSTSPLVFLTWEDRVGPDLACEHDETISVLNTNVLVSRILLFSGRRFLHL